MDGGAMKILRCNGRTMEVYDAKLIMKLECRDFPIKFHGTHVLSDDKARDVVKQAMRDGAIKEN